MLATAADDLWEGPVGDVPAVGHGLRRVIGADAIRFAEDLALARRIAAGDPLSVRLLIGANQRRLLRTAWNILKDHAEADDAVQSGFANAVAAIGRYSGRSALSTWLTRIVMNEALARLRKLRSRAERLSDERLLAVSEYRQALGGYHRHDTPEAALVRGEIRVALDQAIHALPQVFRDVFLLRAVDGLSVAETAEQLGVNAATVKTRHLRARRRLREALSPQLGSCPTTACS